MQNNPNFQIISVAPDGTVNIGGTPDQLRANIQSSQQSALMSFVALHILELREENEHLKALADTDSQTPAIEAEQVS